MRVNNILFILVFIVPGVSFAEFWTVDTSTSNPYPHDYQACGFSKPSWAIDFYDTVYWQSYGSASKYKCRWTDSGGSPQYGDIVFRWPSEPSCPDGKEYTDSGCVVPQPPECLEGTRWDEEAGECVQLDTVCFTNIETESEECRFVEYEDDDGYGCITNPETGREMCLTDTPNCVEHDGNRICWDNESKCGVYNGSFQCLKPTHEGCGYFNGVQVCYTEDGKKIDQDSPDHPQNGGNADGDETNDEKDSRPPEDGGDPNNQPGVQLPTTDDNRASEQTLGKLLQEARRGNDLLEELGENLDLQDLIEEAPDNGAQVEQDKVESEGQQQIDDSGIDGLIGDMGTNPIGQGDVEGVGNDVLGIVPDGSCTSVGIKYKSIDWSIDCDDVSRLRNLLGWLFYLFTAWYLFELITTPVGSRV